MEKEELKNTILRHDEIFRNQVYELHRLYRKQRDLMEELKKKRFELVFFSRRINGPFDSRAMKPPRRMIDLELPAEAYVDFEDEEAARAEDFFDPKERKSAPPCLGDLNEPPEDEAASSGESRRQDLNGQQRSDSSPDAEELCTDEEVVDADSSSCSKLQRKQFHEAVDLPRAAIDLNSSAASFDRPEISPVSATRFVPVVDLEAPPGEDPEHGGNPAETLGDCCELAEAAEALFIMKRNQRRRSPPSSGDALRWLAELVTGDAGCSGESAEESGLGGIDCFERAALDLDETRFGENFYGRSTDAGEPEEEEEEEEEDLVHLRRVRSGGQSRHRRRDFRRDICPGLASLSMEEEAADLQKTAGEEALRPARKKTPPAWRVSWDGGG